LGAQTQDAEFELPASQAAARRLAPGPSDRRRQLLRMRMGQENGATSLAAAAYFFMVDAVSGAA